jgi:hypothetical protein
MSTKYPSVREIKLQAKLLRQAIKERLQIDVQHSDSLELIARSLGLKDWNTLSAKAEENIFRESTESSPLLAHELIEILGRLDSKCPVLLERTIEVSPDQEKDGAYLSGPINVSKNGSLSLTESYLQYDHPGGETKEIPFCTLLETTQTNNKASTLTVGEMIEGLKAYGSEVILGHLPDSEDVHADAVIRSTFEYELHVNSKGAVTFIVRSSAKFYKGILC